VIMGPSCFIPLRSLAMTCCALAVFARPAAAFGSRSGVAFGRSSRALATQPRSSLQLGLQRLMPIVGSLVIGAVAGSALTVRADEGFTIPDQVKRFAQHKRTNNQRALDIDKFYDGKQLLGKRVLVTGGNRGIGLALATQLKADGAKVIVTCRKTSPELDALSIEQVITGVDVAMDEDMPTMVKALDGKLVDVLINNAGYFYEPEEKIDSLNFKEEMKMIDICALGPLRITAALVNAGLLTEGSKVAVITSQGGSVTWRDVQNPSGGDYGHHMSKCAANMMSVLLAKELFAKGIAVMILHPGFNKTGMTAKYKEIWEVEGAVDVAVGAKRVLHEVNVGSLKTSGKFINCEDGLMIPF